MADNSSETTADSSGIDQSWALVKGYDVKQGRYIHLPDEAQTAIQTDTIKGPSVFWNYDTNSKWVVLSSDPIADDSYKNAEYTKIQNPNEGHSRIRSPKSLGVQISSKFAAGNQMFYLARDSDLTAANPRVFLLTQDELAPHIDIGGTDGQDSAEEQILQNPGFLP